jgi:hypothetical protein
MNTHEQDMKDLKAALKLIKKVQSREQVLGLGLLTQAASYITSAISDSEYEEKTYNVVSKVKAADERFAKKSFMYNDK